MLKFFSIAVLLLISIESLIKAEALLKGKTWRVLNGVTAAPINKKMFGKRGMKNNGDYPYMASLQEREHDSHICGAIIVKENAVLTAAHCVENKKPFDLIVRAGFLDFEQKRITDGVQIVSVHKYRIHPDHRKIDKSNNDIAIVWVKPNFIFGRYVNAVNLASEKQDYTAEKGFIIGWGHEKPGKVSRYLLRADLVILSHEKCKKAHSARPHRVITEAMICAIHKRCEQTITSGDSGGPLIVRNKETEGDILVGIISWSTVYGMDYYDKNKVLVTQDIPCADYPIVFANIAKLKPWIIKNL